MQRNRFQCPSCGTLTNSIRCPSCGTDTEECDAKEEHPTREHGYSIFDHAQHGHVRNTLTRAAHKASHRRFSGEPLTGFGGLQ